MNTAKQSVLDGLLVAAALIVFILPVRAQALTPDEARAIALEAYIYGLLADHDRGDPGADEQCAEG